MNDDVIAIALRRLNTYVRLKELQSPQTVIDGACVIMEASKKELGSRWAKVEELLPAYQEWHAACERLNEEWESKCQECIHSSTSYAYDESDSWCDAYTIQNKTCPAPCPGFSRRLKMSVDMN